MKYISLLLLLVTVTTSVAQSDSSVYKKLETRKFYDVSCEKETRNGKSTYTVNDKKVSKSTYNKYSSTWENMETCCPCILKSYDEHDVLLSEAVSCTDCGVGVFKNYYPNGKVSLTGSYKENPTGDWDNIFYRGYCNVPVGAWTYFDTNGDTLYTEFWQDGEFIKQVPEQETN